MCGIVGFIGPKNLKKLNTLLECIEHRGRDERILYWKANVHMGMNRLAIIDLTKNLYPMLYKQYVLIFNGEIYNFHKLKERLLKSGVNFCSSSDAEVILPLYHRYGTDAFSMLEGMFALCILDTKKKNLILARDKSGEKPLYYTQSGKNFAFASELKVLLSDPANRYQLRTSVLNQYLRNGFVYPPHTLVNNIQKIPPSGYVTIDVLSQKTKYGTYWDPPIYKKSDTHTLSETDCINTLDTLLYDSISLRLIADVPIGCFLSGGVDSSLLTALASKETKNIKTYSITFPGGGTTDESQYSQFVARALHTDHTEIHCTQHAVTDLISNIGKLIDEPIVDPASIPTLLLAKEAKKRVSVVLTGEGADELFGGYSRYQRELYMNTVKKFIIPTPRVSLLWQSLFPNKFIHIRQQLQDRYSPQRIWNDLEIKQLVKSQSDILKSHKYLYTYGKKNPLLSMQLTDYRGYMAEQLLMKVDKSTMLYTVEARAPYLDSKLITFAFNLPNRYKIRLFGGKYLLKKVAERYFPKQFIYRKKHGFDLPLCEWFRGDLRPIIYTSLDRLKYYQTLFHYDMYKKIVNEHMHEGKDHSGKLWSILVLTQWMDAHNIAQ